MEINHQSIPVGSVAYYIKKVNTDYHWRVCFGIVDEHYPSCICLRLIEPKDTRTINNIPYANFVTPTEWQKLPKNWTYDTQLFETGATEEFDEIHKVLGGVKMNDPKAILDAYSHGYLVDSSTIDRARIEVVIENHQWRLERKYDSADNKPTHVSINWFEVYQTFKEAQAVVDAHDAECERVMALSDYDWSVEQIDEVLNRWVKMCGGSKAIKAKYREWLLKQDKVEDIEVRTYMGEVQWKYAKNKRWMSIEI